MVLFVWVILKIWILIFGSRLDSGDHCYVLLIVPDHLELSCLICLQANSINISKSIRSQNLFFLELNSSCRNFRRTVGASEIPRRVRSCVLLPISPSRPATLCFIRTSDGVSELPTPIGSSILPPTRCPRVRVLIRSELPIKDWNFRQILCSYIYPFIAPSNPNSLNTAASHSLTFFSQRFQESTVGFHPLGALWIPLHRKIRSPPSLLQFPSIYSPIHTGNFKVFSFKDSRCPIYHCRRS